MPIPQHEDDDLPPSTNPLFRVLVSIRNVTIADLVSGCVLSLVLSGFGAAFSSAIFDEVNLDRYVSIGRGTQSVAIFVAGFAHVFFSDMGLVIAAPDVTPTVFFASMAATCREQMILDSGELQPDPEQLLSTILTCMIISTFFLGVFLLILGNLKLTRIVQLLPTSVLSGFMASIGYTICQKALSLSMPQEIWDLGPGSWDWWRLFVPAVILGSCMFLQARFKLGRNIIAMPALMLVPLILFYIIVFSALGGTSNARQEFWFLNKVQLNATTPTKQYVESYGSASLVDWRAVQAAVPSMLLLWLVVLCDLLLKLSGIRRSLGAFNCRIDHEVILAGKVNLISALLVGAPGYAQPGLTNISAGVVKDKRSRVPGLIAASFNLGLFISGFPIVTYLPRFWLAGMLFFAGIGLLVENIIDSHPRVSHKEWSAIIVIVIINAVSSLGWSILAGIVLSASIFAIAYGRGGAIKQIMSGVTFHSTVIRSLQDEAKLAHLGNKVLIIVLHRYLFFGSVASVTELVEGFLREQATSKRSDAVSYYVFDWEGVEDIDATAVTAFAEVVHKLITGHEAPTVLFTSLSPAIRRKLTLEHVTQNLHSSAWWQASASSMSTADDVALNMPLNERRIFDSLDFGVEWIENRLLAKAASIRQLWLAKFDSFRRLHQQARAIAQNEANEHVLGTRLGGVLHPYVRPYLLRKGQVLYKAGDEAVEMYLIQRGRVSLWAPGSTVELKTRVRSVRRGAFINEEAVYSEGQALCSTTAQADQDSLVYGMSKAELDALDVQLPKIAIEVHRRILQSVTATRRQLERVANDLVDDIEQPAATPAAAAAAQQHIHPASRQEKLAQSLVKIAQSPMRMLEGGLIVVGMKRNEDSEDSGLLNFENLIQGDASGRRIARVLAANDNLERPLSPDKEQEELGELSTNFDLSDPRLQDDWMALSLGTSTVHADQLVRTMRISKEQAEELVWEADTHERGALSFADVLRAVTTVAEEEIVQPIVDAETGREIEQQQQGGEEENTAAG